MWWGGGAAAAAGLQPGPSREPLSALEVERALVLPRGWLELGFTFAGKSTSEVWSGGGSRLDAGRRRWVYTTEEVGLRYGLASRAEVFGSLPLQGERLIEPDGSTALSAFGMGDSTVGWAQEWATHRAPTRSLISAVSLYSPTGREAVDAAVGDPSAASALVMSTGQVGLGLALSGKLQLEPVGVVARAEYVHHFAGQLEYTIADFGGATRLRAGDELRIRVVLQAQLMVLLPAIAVDYRRWMESRVGDDGGWTSALTRGLAGSDGWSVNATPSLTLQLSRGLDLRGSIGIPLRGEDSTFFPLEALTPTPGLTGSGTLLVRY